MVLIIGKFEFGGCLGFRSLGFRVLSIQESYDCSTPTEFTG